MDDLWTYDLRRSCATIMANRGTNLGLISKGILNHTNLQHTGVYIQSMLGPVETALQEHSEFLLSKGRGEIEVPRVSDVRLPAVHSEEWPG